MREFFEIWFSYAFYWGFNFWGVVIILSFYVFFPCLLIYLKLKRKKTKYPNREAIGKLKKVLIITFCVLMTAALVNYIKYLSVIAGRETLKGGGFFRAVYLFLREAGYFAEIFVNLTMFIPCMLLYAIFANPVILTILLSALSPILLFFAVFLRVRNFHESDKQNFGRIVAFARANGYGVTRQKPLSSMLGIKDNYAYGQGVPNKAVGYAVGHKAARFYYPPIAEALKNAGFKRADRVGNVMVLLKSDTWEARLLYTAFCELLAQKGRLIKVI